MPLIGVKFYASLEKSKKADFPYMGNSEIFSFFSPVWFGHKTVTLTAHSGHFSLTRSQSLFRQKCSTETATLKMAFFGKKIDHISKFVKKYFDKVLSSKGVEIIGLLQAVNEWG